MDGLLKGLEMSKDLDKLTTLIDRMLTMQEGMETRLTRLETHYFGLNNILKSKGLNSIKPVSKNPGDREV